MLSFSHWQAYSSRETESWPSHILGGSWWRVSSLLCGWGQVSSCLQPGFSIQVSMVSVPGLLLLVPSRKLKTWGVTCSKQEGLIVHLIKMVPGEAEDLEAGTWSQLFCRLWWELLGSGKAKVSSETALQEVETLLWCLRVEVQKSCEAGLQKLWLSFTPDTCTQHLSHNSSPSQLLVWEKPLLNQLI